MKFQTTTALYGHLEVARVALNRAVIEITRQAKDTDALEFGSQLSSVSEGIRRANSLLGHVDDLGIRFVVENGQKQEKEPHAKKKGKAKRAGGQDSEPQGKGATAKTIPGMEGESGRRET